MAEFELSDEIQSLVEANGDIVAIHSKDCVIWQAEHKNCKGCLSELGCGKMVRLMLLMLQQNLYRPRDYNDFCQMHDRIAKLLDRVLAAKTTKELSALPDF